MSLIGFFIVIIILVLVIIYITRPFFNAQAETELATAGADMVLHAEYQAVLEQIRELDFEFQLDKISQVDHDAQREDLKIKAAARLQEIQALETLVDSPAPSQQPDRLTDTKDSTG